MAFKHNSKLADDEPSWGEVDKTALPRIAFADMGEPDKKSTWKYPHHWVKGGTKKDENGIWEDGELYLHRGGLITAWAYAHGARTGQKADKEVIEHLAAHRKELGMDEEGSLQLNEVSVQKLGRGIWFISQYGMMSYLVSGFPEARLNYHDDNVIEIKGVLTKEDPLAGTTYNYIRSKIKAALSRGYRDLVFIIDSHGGEVDGLFGLAHYIKALKEQGVKITSVVDEHAYSAAYLLASLGDKVVMSRMGGVGSIGVIAAHLDISGLEQNMGIKWTFVSAGEWKDLLNPHRPVTEEDIDYLSARVNSLYQEFVGLVASNRNLAVDKVMELGAGIFHGSSAVGHGLVDELVDDVVSYVEHLKGKSKAELIDKQDVKELLKLITAKPEVLALGGFDDMIDSWQGVQWATRQIHEKLASLDAQKDVIKGYTSSPVSVRNLLIEDAARRRRGG